MKIYTTKEITVKSESVERSCDICGEMANDGFWKDKSRNIRDETKVSYKQTESDHDGGGCAVTKYLDVCPRCFEKVFIPYIENQWEFNTSEIVF